MISASLILPGMPRRAVIVAALLCLPLPSAVAAHSAAVAVDGPGPDGAFNLTYEIHRDAAGPASLALEVVRTDADGSASSARDLAVAELPAGSSTYVVRFLPAEGAGRYAVTLVVDGARGGMLEFSADDASTATIVPFEVPDHPTYVNLTNDTVNADGKTKSPGEALLTRGSVSDANGLAELDGLLWRIERAGAGVLDGQLAPPANATSWSFEHRFDRSPFEAGNYTLHLRAVKSSAVVASAARTFVIREVAPTFVGGALANVTPDEETTQTVSVVLADKNGAPPGGLEARVYRASTRVEGAGFNATLGAPARLADAEGAGRFAYPLALRVPAQAPAASYRVSIYADGALIGSLPFEVLRLPTLAEVNATAVGARLALAVSGSGDGFLVGRLTDGEGAATSVGTTFVNGTGALSLDAPRRGVPLRWNVTLHAREGGPVVAAREGNWTPPSDAPPIALDPIHVRARLPAAWRVSSAWPLDGTNATFSFTRWDGQPETRVQATLTGDRVRVSAPADIPAGRYSAHLTLRWPNGTASEATWAFDAGPWVELALGAPSVDGRAASVPITNAGGIGISRLVVETDPQTNVTLVRGNETHAPSLSGGRASFSVSLPPGEDATLRIGLPDGALRAGRHDVSVRVLARVSL